jgi:hypothetical protein
MIELSKGLFIENQGLLLPWGITNEEAWHIGSPAPWNLPEDRLRMKWDRAVILGGLECVVQTYFPTSDARLSSFNIRDAHYDQRLPTVWAGILITHCQQVFGDGQGQRTWNHDNTTIHLCHDDRFVEAYWLSIEKRV